MKNFAAIFLGMALLIASAVKLVTPDHVSAQTGVAPFIVVGPVVSPTSCAWPPSTTATFASGVAFCATTSTSSPIYISVASGGTTTPFAPLVPTQASGVFPQNAAAVANEFLSAYNNATGAFTAVQVNFANISGTLVGSQMPTATTCTESESVSSTSQTITLSACH